MSADPREVLADRIQEWAGEADLYHYVDGILNALDRAGLQIIGNGTEGDENTPPDYSETEGYNEPLADFIRDALAAYPEYDGVYRTDRGVEMRLYFAENVVNALAPRMDTGAHLHLDEMNQADPHEVVVHFKGGPWDGQTHGVGRVVGPVFAVGHAIGNHYWLDTKSDPPTYHWNEG